MEMPKPKHEQPKYPSRERPLVRQIFAEEMRKHRNKTKDQCLEYLRDNGLMCLLPKSLR